MYFNIHIIDKKKSKKKRFILISKQKKCAYKIMWSLFNILIQDN